MNFLNSIKNRIAVNLKVTKLSFMTQPNHIIRTCHDFSAEERSQAIKAIESMFRWQPVAQMAQSMFPSYYSGGGVSPEALDMASHGQVSGGLELMRLENQAAPASMGGMLPIQQAALSFAWTVLKALEQQPSRSNPAVSAPDSVSTKRFCPDCGQRRSSEGRFCTGCGKAFQDSTEPQNRDTRANAAAVGTTAREPVGAQEAKSYFALLKEQVEKEKPKMDDASKQGVENVMSRLDEFVEDYGSVRTVDDSLQSRAKLGSLMESFLPMVARPTLEGPGPVPGSAGERVLSWMQELKMFTLALSTGRGEASGVRETALQMFPRIASLTTQISKAGTDARAIQDIEVKEVRALAHEVRMLARQRHVTLAKPVWKHRDVPVDVNCVFFSGPAEVYPRIRNAASLLNLQISHPAPIGAEFAGCRWHDLRSAGLAVFDLSVPDPQVYYELGIALALGTQLLLLAKVGVQPMFDVAEGVHSYSHVEQSSFENELHAALYSVQVRGSKASSLSGTLEYAEALAASSDSNPLLRVMLQSLAAAREDPVRFNAALATFNAYLGTGAHQILFPRRPGSYPDPSSRRCFIVMPFRPEREPAYAAVVRAAKQEGVEPIRGDVAIGKQILDSIWDEICRASCVTADLSEFNCNVALELGIAHALGKPTLLIGAKHTAKSLESMLPGVAKWPCYDYGDAPTSDPAFLSVLSTFFRTMRS